MEGITFVFGLVLIEIQFQLAKEKFPIKIKLPDGKEVDGKAWQTTPYEVAVSIRYVYLHIL